MLIEQAFMSLPEIMLGAGYARQEYEAGIVSAFSLAVLQELNGRNVPKPISCMCAERRYLREGRGLRADLHVNLAKTFSGSEALSKFGYRFSNWIEAKYFRKTKGTPPSTQNLGLLAADILRLLVMPPIEMGKADAKGHKKSITGRYLLHVYQGDPLKHINPKRKAVNAPDRIWPELMIREGEQKINSLELDQEKDAFLKQVGAKLSTVKVQLSIANHVIRPAQCDTSNDLTFVLSRINYFSVSYEDFSFEIHSDRTVVGKETHEKLRSRFTEELKRSKTSEVTSGEDFDDEVFSEEDEDSP